MTLVYHGTNTDCGILAARSRAILSPWEKEIEMIERVYREHPSRSFKAEHPGKTIEEFALRTASLSYAKREVEDRVKCVSASAEIEVARGYAMRFDEHEGGIIFGVEVNDNIPNSPHTIYIPKRLSLSNLKEVHLSPIAEKKHGGQIRREFCRYNPSYFILE